MTSVHDKQLYFCFGKSTPQRLRLGQSLRVFCSLVPKAHCHSNRALLGSWLETHDTPNKESHVDQCRPSIIALQPAPLGNRVKPPQLEAEVHVLLCKWTKLNNEGKQPELHMVIFQDLFNQNLYQGQGPLFENPPSPRLRFILF